jgi:hypothetical protein
VALSSGEEGAKATVELTELVRADLAIRTAAVSRFDIPLPIEIFYFGRPIHIMLKAQGLSVIEKDGIIQITAPQ